MILTEWPVGQEPNNEKYRVAHFFEQDRKYKQDKKHRKMKFTNFSKLPIVNLSVYIFEGDNVINQFF